MLYQLSHVRIALSGGGTIYPWRHEGSNLTGAGRADAGRSGE
jgi:hypothetical protein